MLPDRRSQRSAPGFPSVRAWRALAAAGAVVLLAGCVARTPASQGAQVSPTKQGLIQGGGVSRPNGPPPGGRPKCTYPERVATPEWLPDDLPFPAGTYTAQELGEDAGYHKAVMVLPGTLTAWTRFVLDQWPKSGYILGRGDSEAFEVEDVFSKTPTVGAFKAVSVFCSPGYSKMLLIFAEQSPTLPVLPSPSGTPINPNASPAP